MSRTTGIRFREEASGSTQTRKKRQCPRDRNPGGKASRTEIPPKMVSCQVTAPNRLRNRRTDSSILLDKRGAPPENIPNTPAAPLSGFG